MTQVTLKAIRHNTITEKAIKHDTSYCESN